VVRQSDSGRFTQASLKSGSEERGKPFAGEGRPSEDSSRSIKGGGECNFSMSSSHKSSSERAGRTGCRWIEKEAALVERPGEGEEP